MAPVYINNLAISLSVGKRTTDAEPIPVLKLPTCTSFFYFLNMLCVYMIIMLGKIVIFKRQQQSFSATLTILSCVCHCRSYLMLPFLVEIVSIKSFFNSSVSSLDLYHIIHHSTIQNMVKIRTNTIKQRINMMKYEIPLFLIKVLPTRTFHL